LTLGGRGISLSGAWEGDWRSLSDPGQVVVPATSAVVVRLNLQP
ncbi:MAG: hypothetical protein E1N59_2689, partial [Puniceicoccaceae bacterium 5H]